MFKIGPHGTGPHTALGRTALGRTALGRNFSGTGPLRDPPVTPRLATCYGEPRPWPRHGGLRHMLTVLDGRSRAEWPVALIDWLGDSSDCDLFRRTLRICVRGIQSASETCAFDYHMQDTVVLGIAVHHDQLLRRAYRLRSIFGGSCSYCALLDPTRLCISNTCAQGIRSFQRFGDWSCRMPCIVVSDIVRRYGHVPGNVRTLRR